MLVVFTSVIWRYFLHDPLLWAEEIARALMVTQVFLGAAAALGRAQHVGIDSFRGLFPSSWRVPRWSSSATGSSSRSLSRCSCRACSLLVRFAVADDADSACRNGSTCFPAVAGSLLMIAVWDGGGAGRSARKRLGYAGWRAWR